MTIKYTNINFEDKKELALVAKLHVYAPLNWDEKHVIDEEAIPMWIEYFQNSKNNDDIFFVVARSESVIVGFHWLRVAERYGERCAYIDSLWVHDDFRRNGISKQMKEKGENWAKSKDIKFIATDVNYNNKRMIEYNLRHGFFANNVEMLKNI